MKLYPFQKELVTSTHSRLAIGENRLLIVAPTGSGKTIMAAQLIQDLASAGMRLLFLVHLDVLVGQTSEKLERFGVQAGFIKAGYTEDRSAPVQIASVQTLIRRDWWQSQHFDIVIFDEAHRTAFSLAAELIRDVYPNAVHLGLTATPWRLNPRQGLSDYFQESIAAPLPRELMQMGFLAKPRYFSVAGPDLKVVRKEAGDFKVDDLETACNTRKLVAALVDEWESRANGYKTIAFGVTVAHSQAIADEFTRRGIPAALVCGETPITERTDLYQKLSIGEIQVLSSCNALSEGFDEPSIECALLARPTLSKALFVQQLGRALRIHEGKRSPIILDQAGNVFEFGTIESLGEYKIVAGREFDEGSAPVKVCPECGSSVPAMLPVCPECGYKFISDEIVEPSDFHEIVDEDLSVFFGEKTPRQRIDELVAEQKDRGYKSAWVYYRIADEARGCIGLEDLKYLAKILGYKQGWARYKYAELRRSAPAMV